MKSRRVAPDRRPGSVRIIGGEWRRRRLPIVDSQRLRPTTDRVRETLFNWLSPVLPGSRCLDLFAGTGALSFEAVSRGADRAVMIEVDPNICRQLRDNIASLHTDKITLHETDAFRWMQSSNGDPYDIVFVDPPFGGDELSRALTRLDEKFLHSGSFIYLESDQDLEGLDLPQGFDWYRRSRMGNVHFGLASSRGS